MPPSTTEPASPEPQNHWAAGAEELAAEAAGLVNPASGVANDYLNHFNEILLLIENLPVLLPEMVDELLQWSPKTYQEYFQSSPLPGSAAAIAIYERLGENFRNSFETRVAEINKLAGDSVAIISNQRDVDGNLCATHVEEFCEAASAQMRKRLQEAENLVNYGKTEPAEAPQQMADRLLSASGFAS